MKLRFGRLLATVLVSVLGSQASSAPPSHDSIIVTGDRPGQARQQAESYVAELGIATGEQPTARWIDPICPHAIGISKQHAKLVEEQLRRVIVEVGAPLAKSGCVANFDIVFTDSAEAIVSYVERRDDRASRELPPSSVRELTRGAAPIRWWYNTEMRSRDGTPITWLSFLPGVQLESDQGVGTLPTGRSGSLSLYSSSIVSTQMVRGIQFASVIVDVKRAEGVRLSSVVDYAALVGLAEVKLGAAPPRSVLSLFQPNGDQTLTIRDRAFLTGLYRIAMDRRARQQRQALVSAVASEGAN